MFGVRKNPPRTVCYAFVPGLISCPEVSIFKSMYLYSLVVGDIPVDTLWLKNN